MVHHERIGQTRSIDRSVKLDSDDGSSRALCDVQEFEAHVSPDDVGAFPEASNEATILTLVAQGMGVGFVVDTPLAMSATQARP